MSFETWRRKQKATVASIFKNTMNEAADRTRDHLTQFQEQGKYSNSLLPVDDISLSDDALIQESCENGNEPYQMLYEAGVDDVITFGKGVIDLVKVGVDTFFHMAELHPTHFYDFLRRTEEFFDAYIQAYCEQENVRFIGGKLRIDLASEEVLNLTADFYFYTHEETWSVQHKEGSLKVDTIIDWEDNPDLSELRGEGYLEYPLEPPESSNSCKK